MRWDGVGSDEEGPTLIGDGLAAIAVRFFGAAVAVMLGVAGTRWGAQAALAAVAALAVAVLLIERRLESRKG